MELIAREQLYVHADNYDILKELKSNLTFNNPDYGKKKALGFSVWNTPTHITLYKKHEGGLIIPRGTGKLARSLAEKYNEPFKILDQRTDGELIDVSLTPEITPFWYQNLSVEKMVKFQQGMIEAPCACLVGETVINFNRGKKGFSCTLEKAYKRFNNQDNNAFYNWDKNIPTMVRSFNGERIRLHEIEDIVYNGKTEVWQLILENGNSITGTHDHKIMTKQGWVPLDKCSNQEIMCDVLKPCKTHTETKRRGTQRLTELHYHPYARTQNSPKSVNGISKVIEIHRGIYEAHINKLPLKDFLDIVRLDKIKARKLKYIDPSKYHIHHKDGNHFNNNIENLECLLITEHKQAHINIDNFHQGIPIYSRCVDIRYIGLRKVYDILCKDPYHNFVANGIVVHNSGKTIMGLTFISHIKKRALIVVHTKDLFKQWEKEISDKLDGNFKKGVVGAGRHKHGDVTIAMIQTLVKSTPKQWKDIQGRYTISIWDESHHAGADTYVKCISRMQGRYIIGLTATPKRRDKKDFLVKNYLGDVVHKVTYDDLEQSGRTVGCKVKIMNTGCTFDITDILDNHSEISSTLSRNIKRNDFIVDCIMEDLKEGRIPMILTERKYHVYILVSKLKEMGVKVGEITGEIPDFKRVKIKEQIKKGELEVLVANKQIAAEGLDIPNIDSVHIAFWTTNKGLIKQMVGRGRRVHKGKEYCKVWFYKDDFQHLVFDNKRFTEELMEVNRYKYGILNIKKWFYGQGFEVKIC